MTSGAPHNNAAAIKDDTNNAGACQRTGTDILETA